MKKLMLIISLALLIFASCKKEEPEPPECQKFNYGVLEIQNYDNEAYKVYIDGTYWFTQGGLSKDTAVLELGWHEVKTYEVDYIFSQDVYTLNVEINQCETTYVSYGQKVKK